MDDVEDLFGPELQRSEEETNFEESLLLSIQEEEEFAAQIEESFDPSKLPTSPLFDFGACVDFATPHLQPFDPEPFVARHTANFLPKILIPGNQESPPLHPTMLFPQPEQNLQSQLQVIQSPETLLPQINSPPSTGKKRKREEVEKENTELKKRVNFHNSINKPNTKSE